MSLSRYMHIMWITTFALHGAARSTDEANAGQVHKTVSEATDTITCKLAMANNFIKAIMHMACSTCDATSIEDEVDDIGMRSLLGDDEDEDYKYGRMWHKPITASDNVVFESTDIVARNSGIDRNSREVPIIDEEEADEDENGNFMLGILLDDTESPDFSPLLGDY